MFTYSKNRATQAVVFDNLVCGATDIDAIIEYKNKGFVFFETKFGDKELPFGQKLALERLVDSCKKPALLLITSHQYAEHEDIHLSETIVRSFYWKRQWHLPKIDGITAGEMTNNFIRYLNGDL